MKILNKALHRTFVFEAVRVLTKGECLILMFWLQDPPSYICTNKELAKRTNVTPQYIGRVMKSLVSKGILTVTKNPGFANIYEPRIEFLAGRMSVDERVKLLKEVRRTSPIKPLNEVNKELWETTTQEESTIYN